MRIAVNSKSVVAFGWLLISDMPKRARDYFVGGGILVDDRERARLALQRGVQVLRDLLHNRGWKRVIHIDQPEAVQGGKLGGVGLNELSANAGAASVILSDLNQIGRK